MTEGHSEKPPLCLPPHPLRCHPYSGSAHIRTTWVRPFIPECLSSHLSFSCLPTTWLEKKWCHSSHRIFYVLELACFLVWQLTGRSWPLGTLSWPPDISPSRSRVDFPFCDVAFSPALPSWYLPPDCHRLFQQYHSKRKRVIFSKVSFLSHYLFRFSQIKLQRAC